MSVYKYWFDKHGYRETISEHDKYESKLKRRKSGIITLAVIGSIFAFLLPGVFSYQILVALIPLGFAAAFALGYAWCNNTNEAETMTFQFNEALEQYKSEHPEKFNEYGEYRYNDNDA